MRRSVWLAALIVALAAPSVEARDWFVRAGSEGGDGSKEKPFKDPYLALEKCEAGDVIHVAKGVYHGKLDTGRWDIDMPNLTMLGGYNDSFTERNPWTTPSELRKVKDSKSKVPDHYIVAGGKGDHTGFVLDGFVLDHFENNAYAEDGKGDIDFLHTPREEIARFWLPNVQVRNCLFLNGSGAGVELTGNGCRVENNIFMNCAGPWLVDLKSPPPALEAGAKPSVVTHNTFLFAWSEFYGTGRGDGVGVKVWGGAKAEITDNVFQNCDNHAIMFDGRPENAVIKNNAFWMNAYSNVKFFMEGRDVAVDNSNMGDLDDVGFKACEGNEVKDPGFGAFDSKWMERYINRSAAERGKVTMDDWNKMRQILGLPLKGEGGKGPTGFCMAYDWQKAIKLEPKIPQGAHPKSLEVKFSGGGAATSAKYEPAEFKDVFTTNKWDGKRVEVICWIDGEKSQYYHPGTGVSEKEWMGIELKDAKDPSGLPPLAYFKKGTNAQRVIESTPHWTGPPSPQDRRVVRGVAKYDETASFRCKGTILIESVEPYVEKIVEDKRPIGRDWFVRAGSSGNGSKEKPFKDPWQALEKAEKGDFIHVAEGEYWGKLKCGFWNIDTPYLTMLGGYDKDFKERDPWKHPTKLGYPKGSKAWTSGAYIRGANYEETRGFIFDGFVLDGAEVNKYGDDGDLHPSESAREGLIEVNGPGMAVRNCVLVNGSLASINTTADYGTVENCILLNYHWLNLQVVPARNERPWLFKNNTILFSWYDRADGQGHSSVGAGLYTRGDVAFEADANIIGYCDEFGILTSSDPKRVKITNNVFMKNLFAHLSNQRDLIIDDNTWSHWQDAGFIDGNGNRKDLDPKLPFDKAWMTVYMNRTQTIPGKVKDDDWNKTREILGLPQIATGGVAATGYARIYPWKGALTLFPQNPECKAGAHAVPLTVEFKGVTPKEEAPKSYETVEYSKFQTDIASLDGKSIEFVAILGEIKESTSYDFLPGATGKDVWAVDIYGPAGKGESGLPCMGYYPKGTRLEKAIKNSDDKSKYKIRGTAHKGPTFNRGLIVIESIEKVD